MTSSRHFSRGPSTCIRLVLLTLFLSAAVAETQPRKKAINGIAPKPTKKAAGKDGNSKEPYEPITLQDSVKKSMHQDAQAAREKYWQKTLEEIRALANPNTISKKKKSKTETDFALNRWKIFSEEKTTQGTSTTQQPARYNGFISWDRLLQEWKEDIEEYMEKIETEGKGQYRMSSFGVPKEDEAAVTTTKDTSEPLNVAAEIISNITSPAIVTADETATVETTTKTTRTARSAEEKVPRPIPAPRKEGEAVLPHTDISDKSKRVWIVTTATLPWMTGTAVNPLLRAAYMTTGRKEAGGSVTLMLPWLERKEDQDSVYGEGKTFDTPEDQEAHIRNWLKNSAKMEHASVDLNIRWYTAWQNKIENSIYSMGDIIATISEDEVDIMVLEEPEHLNWYRAPGESWTKKFKHVVGIVHTNYFVYAQDQPGALVRAPAMKLLCTWMCRSHCHRLIKLSGTLGQYAPEKELIENVHGVRGAFIETGVKLRDTLSSPEKAALDPIFSPTAEPAVYFIGKMLWSKGIGALMELLKYAEETASIRLHVDMYGGGPDKDAAEAKAEKLGLNMSFLGPIDHPELAFTHKVFINPSTSEVLCTTVAEALAMGKFVVVPSHPSNDFFAQFPNCLTYSSKDEFVGNLYFALTHSPEPMSEEYSHALSWKAATERFEAAGCIPVDEALHYEKWVQSDDAGVEITLPPLIESEKGRKLVASTFEKSRASFRKFRDNLSQDISTSKVLPKSLRENMARELDRRLDLDIDELLSSPKLELKLSPAELDRQLVELYETISKGPSGDILRVIGGGQEVGLQDRYMKRQALKRLKEARARNITSPFFLENFSDPSDSQNRTASQWVTWAMRRNLPRNSTVSHYSLPTTKPARGATKKQESNLRMSLVHPLSKRQHCTHYTSWSGLTVPGYPSSLLRHSRTLSFRSSTRGLSLLI